MYTSDQDRRYLDALEYHFNPLIPLFGDPTITDVEVNPEGDVHAHHVDGFSERLPIEISDRSIKAVAFLLAARLQDDISPDAPSLAAMWPNPPLRIHIILPPAVEKASVVIRRPSSQLITLDAMAGIGTCTQAQVDLLKHLIRGKRNMIVSGETGSGKTTLLNALIDVIPPEERLYIIEDTQEIQCTSPNKVLLLTTGKYTCRMAVKDALRFRPDRILVGEVRDGAALDLIQAWNTGHPGGLCTIHANSPDMVFERLKSLVQQVSRSAQEDLIKATLDAVVQITLCEDGIRRITEIKQFHRI